MTINNLKQYVSILDEITLLSEKIEKIKNKQSMTCDSVKGSDSDEPYNLHSIKIYGVDNKIQNKLDKLRYELLLKQIDLLALSNDIEYEISKINDSTVRRIIRYHYLDSLSWNATAMEIYKYPCGDRVRKKISRFFKKN